MWQCTRDSEHHEFYSENYYKIIFDEDGLIENYYPPEYADPNDYGQVWCNVCGAEVEDIDEEIEEVDNE